MLHKYLEVVATTLQLFFYTNYNLEKCIFVSSLFLIEDTMKVYKMKYQFAFSEKYKIMSNIWGKRKIISS